MTTEQMIFTLVDISVRKNIADYLKQMGRDARQENEPLRNAIYAYCRCSLYGFCASICNDASLLAKHRDMLLNDRNKISDLAYLGAVREWIYSYINKQISKDKCYPIIAGIGCAFGTTSATDLWNGYMELVDATYQGEEFGAHHVTGLAIDPAVDWIFKHFCPAEHGYLLPMAKAIQDARERVVFATNMFFLMETGKQLGSGFDNTKLDWLARSLPFKTIHSQAMLSLKSTEWLAGANAVFTDI